MTKPTLRILPALLMACHAEFAAAGAFQLLEQNASGLGTAYAGSAAVAENASALHFNPANLMQLQGKQLSLGAVGIGTRYEYRNQGSTDTFGATVPGSNGGNAGGWTAVPNAHLSAQVGERWGLGLGIAVPFGLTSDYSRDWVGAAQALKSEIKTLNVNPSLAYRLSDKVSLGLGLNYQTIDGTLTNRFARLTGDDASWGWNAGALINLSPAMRLGFAYRSAIKHRLEGRLEGVSGRQDVQADLKLPDTFTLSVWQQMSERWEAMGDLSYTRWNGLRGLNVMDRNAGTQLISETMDYGNAWRIAWGAAYKANDRTKLKFGLAYDHSPIKDASRSPRVPDSDYLWLSVGGQWQMAQYGTFDVGYSYLLMRDAKLDRTENGMNLRGRYESGAHIVGAQYSLGF